jgi:LmbE family N-acetylglucosaminyl deacetylase
MKRPFFGDSRDGGAASDSEPLPGGSPLIDVMAPGSDEPAWRSTIDRARLPRWKPGAHGIALIVSPHPDDEVLAVGGLLHDLVARGWRVRLASVTDGESAYPDVAGLGTLRRHELAAALGSLGIAGHIDVHPLHLPDGQVARHEAALASQLMPLTRGVSWMLAPWREDGHPDHEACGRAAAAAALATTTTIRFFPVWVWHWMRPGSAAADRMLATAERHDLTPRAVRAKRAALHWFVSQQNGAFGPAILPPHVLERFTRPFEVLLR